MMMTPQILTEILEIGTRAISTCNTQPWRFRYRGEALHIYMILAKNFFLKLEGNLWIELGTLLENISVGAASKGFQIEYRMYERCGVDEPAAIVKFIPANLPPVNLEPVLRRCTNRRPYSQMPLPKEVQEAVIQSSASPDIDIKILSGIKKQKFAEILANLEDLRLGNRLLVKEVLPYVRIDEKEVEEHRDRLDVRTMNYDPFSLSLIKMAKKHPQLFYFAHQLFSRLGVQARKFKRSLIQSGALIVLTINEHDQGGYVNLGRTTQRILNVLTGYNVQTYTMVSGLYPLDLLKENLEIYSHREQVLLLRYQYDLQSFFNFTSRKISLFIKAGYGDPPLFRSVRKRVEDVMLNEEGDPLSGK